MASDETRWARAKELLRDQTIPYRSIIKEIKKEFGVGVGVSKLKRLEAEIESENAAPGEIPPEKVVHVALPAEMVEPVEDELLAMLRAVRGCMKRRGIQEMRITSDGGVSFLSWHDADIGNPGD
jgi:hypothetical protein